MTKVQVRFHLQKPPDEAALARLSDAAALYGIYRIKLSNSMDFVMVEYDASRLRPAEVESALARAGLPVEPVAQ
jgi:hypothetical protein